MQGDPNPPPAPSRGRRLREAIENHPVVVIVTVFVVVVGSLITVVQWAFDVTDYFSNPSWQEQERDRLTDLQAGVDVAYFRERLGAPTFRRRGTVREVQGIATFEAPQKPVSELSFTGRGWFVQAIVDATGTVIQYALTACDPSLKPVVVLPTEHGRTTLGADTVRSATAPLLRWTESRPFVVGHFSAATSNSYYFELNYLGNPGNYQTVGVGSNDVCGAWLSEEESGELRKGEHGPRLGLIRGFSPRIPEFRYARRIAIAKTYVETAPGAAPIDPDGFPQAIGVDRVTVRVLDRGPGP
jgi:hypothetical protein